VNRLPVFLVMVLMAILIPGTAFAVEVEPSMDYNQKYIDFVFNAPKDSMAEFSIEKTVEFCNPSNESGIPVSALNVSVDIEGISATPEKTSFTVSPSDPPPNCEDVKVTFNASSSMEEGEYTGTLKIMGTNVKETDITIYVEITYPPATINVTWGQQDWGNVKANSTSTHILTVSEVMGYDSADNVSITLTAEGPVKLSYNGDIGFLNVIETKTIKVNVSVPARSLKPGQYTVKPEVTSSSPIKKGVTDAKYQIPYPEMTLSFGELDFDKITFEPGKESSVLTLVINESGGFTPIEGLAVSLVSGEEGWISFNVSDYIPPNESREFDFVVFLPPQASLGTKNWVLRLSTDYAGSRDLQSKVIVYFPGIDRAVEYLKNQSPLSGYPDTGSLIENNILLLEKTKEKNEIRKISMAMSVYSGTRTFLNNLKEADRSKESGDFNRAGDMIIRANAALSKIKIGDENLDDAELKLYSTRCVDLANGIWGQASGDILSTLKSQAALDKETNYKSTALYYRRISEIYSIKQDTENAEKYSKEMKEMESRYKDSLIQASALKTEADEGVKDARARMFGLEDTYVVLNPLVYDRVSNNYKTAIEKYKKAGDLYQNAGELSDASLLFDTTQELISQKEMIYRSFIVYGSLMALLFVWFVVRVSLGWQRFKQDEDEEALGEIVLGGKKEREKEKTDNG